MTDQSSTSHVAARERRKLESAAATHRHDPAMERVLAWARQGDARYDALAPSIKTAAGYYARAKAAHKEVGTS